MRKKSSINIERQRRWTYSTITFSVTAMLIAFVGCSSPVEQDGEETISVPNQIAVIPPGFGESSDGCDEPDENCPPIVITMCDLTNGGASMFLAQLVEYEVVPDPSCEDSPYRPRHEIATFQVVDHIAGDPVGDVVETVVMGYFRFDPPLGEVLLVYTFPFEDKLRLYSPTFVELDQNITLSSERQSGGLTFIFDIPTDYAQFASQAAHFWEHFDTECPGRERHEPHLDEEAYIESFYERPSFCTDDGNGGTVNYNNGSTNQNTNSVEDDEVQPDDD